MNSIKRVIVIFLSLIIAFDIFIIAISLLTKNRILNLKYYQQKFKQNNIYYYLSNKINNNIVAIATKNKIDKSIFEGLVDEKFVEDNINRINIQMIDYFLKAENNMPKANLSLDREIVKLTEDYFNKNQIPLTSEIKQKINLVSNSINQSAEKYIMPVNLEGIQNKEYIQQTRDVINNLYRNLNKYIIILFVAIGLLLVINKFSAIKTLATTLEVVGVILSVPFYTIYFIKLFNRVIIGDEVLKATLVSVSNGYILYLANIGLLAMILGFVMYVMYYILEKNTTLFKRNS